MKIFRSLPIASLMICSAVLCLAAPALALPHDFLMHAALNAPIGAPAASPGDLDILPVGFFIGEHVSCPANRVSGDIDKFFVQPDGRKLARVNDHWLDIDALVPE